MDISSSYFFSVSGVFIQNGQCPISLGSSLCSFSVSGVFLMSGGSTYGAVRVYKEHMCVYIGI